MLDPEMMPSRSVSQASFNFSDNGKCRVLFLESVMTPKRNKAGTSAMKTEERVESPDHTLNTSMPPQSHSMLDNSGSFIKL